MNPSAWLAYDHYGYAAFAVFGTLAAVLLIQWAVLRSRWAGWLHGLQGVAPPFINIIGVLFGLTLAFLANDTWSAHDRAMSAVYLEADALRSLRVLGRELPAPLQPAFDDSLQAYARACADEWPELARRQQSPQAQARGEALLHLLASRAVEQAAGAGVQAQMLREARLLAGERDLRIALSQTHINPLKWLGMAFLGFVTLLSVAVVHIDRPRVLAVATVLFALAAAPTATIVLIQGNPFQQPTAVTPAPILATLGAP